MCQREEVYNIANPTDLSSADKFSRQLRRFSKWQALAQGGFAESYFEQDHDFMHCVAKVQNDLSFVKIQPETFLVKLEVRYQRFILADLLGKVANLLCIFFVLNCESCTFDLIIIHLFKVMLVEL